MNVDRVYNNNQYAISLLLLFATASVTRLATVFASGRLLACQGQYTQDFILFVTF